MPHDLPDRSHLEQIRQRLWRRTEFGQAAVMVGSGFSRNTEKLSPAANPMAQWSDLAEHMYKTLYPPSPAGTSHVSADAIKLAQEFQLTFGRQTLNDLLRKAIPDHQHRPSYLHELLLSLPWSDVFTTNYDTLLERALPSVHGRKYDLVYTASDITRAMKPRIVKLHGSFPSHEPFIVTEEDYRTYPARYAPFVNMVQQSIMENALCLVGFSGDDPNFLHWAGWVRDNLGDAAPPIYLCGLLNLSPSQKRVLESRKILTVDLSPLFSPERYVDSHQRHRLALEWFLLSLRNGAPPRVQNWPRLQFGAPQVQPDYLPTILPHPVTLPEPGERSPKSQGFEAEVRLEVEDMQRLCESWKVSRMAYPGWIVAPFDNRETLWDYTYRWLYPLSDSMQKLSPIDRLYLLFELQWRLDTTLTPLSAGTKTGSRLIEHIQNTLAEINPYPAVLPHEAEVNPASERYRNLDWKRVSESWVQLAFALAREARDDQDEGVFRRWISQLQTVSVSIQREEWIARSYHETCMFYLYRCDQRTVRTNLQQWPQAQLPMWQLRRAAILAELGDLTEAEKIAESALASIRSRLQPYEVDYALLSQEGWAMLLLKAIKDNDFTRMGNPRPTDQFSDRWETLESHKSNPWPHVQQLEQALQSRSVTKPHNLLFDDGYRYAYALQRMLEVAGIPPRCGAVDICSDGVVSAAKRLVVTTPLWAIGSMVRVGQEVKDWFDQVRAAVLDTSQAKKLIDVLVSALAQATHDLRSNQATIFNSFMSQRAARVGAYLLSRLCFRLTAEQKGHAFKLAVHMYTVPAFREYHGLHECIAMLFEGLLVSFDPYDLFAVMSDLLSLPIPTDNGFVVAEDQLWCEPFSEIHWPQNLRVPKAWDRSTWMGPVASLLQLVRTGTPQARERAIVRLDKLHQIGGLTEDEMKQFADGLWSITNERTGLPDHTGLKHAAILGLPSPQPDLATEALRTYFLASDLVRRVNYEDVPGSTQRRLTVGFGSLDHYLGEWLYVSDPFAANHPFEWGESEAIMLLGKAIAWWEHERIALNHDFSGLARAQFQALARVLAQAVLPKLPNGYDEDKARLLKLLSEMRGAGLAIQAILPATLVIDTVRAVAVSRSLRTGLSSWDEREVIESIHGLYLWHVYSSQGLLPAPPTDLFGELVNKVANRRQPALNVAMDYMSDFIRSHDTVVNDGHLDLLCIGLEYLIPETSVSPDYLSEAVVLTGPISRGELPLYRALATKLANELASRLQVDPPGQPVLSDWKAIAQTDPFPIVRRAWSAGAR